MKIEIDIEKLRELKIDANVYVILYMLYNKDSRTLMNYLNSVGKPQISIFEKLLAEGFITLKDIDKKYVPSNIILLDKTNELFEIKRSEFNQLFDEFLSVYPKIVTDGLIKRRLHIEKDTCKSLYKKAIVTNSDINLELHNTIIKALKKEIEERERGGQMKYFVQMPRYLRNKMWETYIGDDESLGKSYKVML